MSPNQKVKIAFSMQRFSILLELVWNLRKKPGGDLTSTIRLVAFFREVTVCFNGVF